MTPMEQMVAVFDRVAAAWQAAGFDGWADDPGLDAAEDALDAAYRVHDLAAFRDALAAFEAAGMASLARWRSCCRWCGRSATAHRTARTVCLRFEARADVAEGVAA